MAKVTYTNFDNNDRRLNEAQKAFNEVRLLLGKANKALMDCVNGDPSQQQSQQSLYEKWFGQYNENNRTQVYGIIHNMLIQLRDKSVTINHDGADCKARDYAYVDAPGGGLRDGVTIFLCNQFFAAPLYGKNSQVGIILHEITHLVGNTEDHKYGETECKRLAQENPNMARNNADNYEFYIESFKTTTR
ncbi:MAG: hypothetical protein F6J92_32545 [Symploca sp. SIO1A3]|nr:hypothetical protein [Symploca sp. SIO1A3]